MSATLLLLVSAVHAADFGAVNGVVRNSATQAPVSHAVVRLIGESERGYVETTGYDGAFHFQKVEPGEYRIAVEHPTFSAKDSGILHVSAGQQTSDLTLTAIPFSAIRGKVVDAEGEAVPDAPVVAIRASWRDGKRIWQSTAWASANEQGEFRVARLESGRYRLFAAPPQDNPLRFAISEGPGTPETHLAPAYYPSGQDLDAAATLDVGAGQELAGFELKLPMKPAFHIRGKAELAADTRGPMPAMVSAVKIDNGRWIGWFAVRGQLSKDGTFDLPGVMPGSYEIWIDRLGQAATESIGVKITSRDVSDVALARLQPAKVQMHCTYDGDPPAERGTPTFQLHRVGRNYAGSVIADDDMAFSYMTRLSNSNMRFENVPPGVYELFLEPGTRQYVESVTYNGQPVTDGAIDIAGGSEAQMDVLLATAGANITGKLNAPASAIAVIVAEDAKPGNPTVQQAPVSPDGRFSVPNLPPGHYRVFAVPPGGTWPWENAGFVKLLGGEAAAVELTRNGSAQVEVALVSEEALRRAEEQVP